jgi:hypothetical protein
MVHAQPLRPRYDWISHGKLAAHRDPANRLRISFGPDVEHDCRERVANSNHSALWGKSRASIVSIAWPGGAVSMSAASIRGTRSLAAPQRAASGTGGGRPAVTTVRSRPWRTALRSWIARPLLRSSWGAAASVRRRRTAIGW